MSESGLKDELTRKVLARWNKLLPNRSSDAEYATDQRRIGIIEEYAPYFDLESRTTMLASTHIMTFRGESNVAFNTNVFMTFAMNIVRNAYRTSHGAFPKKRMKSSRQCKQEYTQHVREHAWRIISRAESVDIIKVAVGKSVNSGIVSYSVLGRPEDHPFADQVCRLLVVKDASLQTASRTKAENDAAGLYKHDLTLEYIEPKPAWLHAAKCKAEEQLLIARRSTSSSIEKARRVFSDAAVAADASRVKLIRRKLTDACYFAYGTNAVARFLQEEEHLHDTNLRSAEKRHLLGSNPSPGANDFRRTGNECLEEALSSFRSYYCTDSNCWHSTTESWVSPSRTTFNPKASFFSLYNQHLTSNCRVTRLVLPYDPHGQRAYKKYNTLTPQAAVCLPKRQCIDGDRKSVYEAQERLCTVLLAENDVVFKRHLLNMGEFVHNRRAASKIYAEVDRLKKEATSFTASKTTPLLDLFATDMDAVSTLASHLYTSRDITALIQAHSSLNVGALRRRLPNLLFDPLSVGWQPSAQHGTTVFRLNTMFDLGAVFAREDPFTRIDGRLFFGTKPPMLKAVLRFYTPSQALVPDVATGPPLQIGINRTDRESGSMRFTGAVTPRPLRDQHIDSRLHANRVRVLATSYDYRGCFRHEMQTELDYAKAEYSSTPNVGPRRMQQATAMLSINAKLQHFFIEFHLQGVTTSGHEVHFTTHTPPFAVVKNIVNRPRTNRPSRSKRKLSDTYTSSEGVR